MNKTTVYILLTIALIVGLVAGYVGVTLLGPAGAGEVRNAKLKAGDEAPDFKLRDHTGRFVELSDYRGKKNIVISFLPGAFTPI
jgi:cytochrome oxidase Cu insertion factor (SCO1/SenC/PrrC family)